MERSNKPKVSKSEFILFSQMLCGIRQLTCSGLELLELRKGINRSFLNSIAETKNMFSLVNKLGAWTLKLVNAIMICNTL